MVWTCNHRKLLQRTNAACATQAQTNAFVDASLGNWISDRASLSHSNVPIAKLTCQLSKFAFYFLRHGLRRPATPAEFRTYTLRVRIHRQYIPPQP
jgi:hypothetical protein